MHKSLLKSECLDWLLPALPWIAPLLSCDFVCCRLEVKPPAVYQIGRLNPHRRVEDTGRVPIKKKLICKWKYDEAFPKSDESAAGVHAGLTCKVECLEEAQKERKELRFSCTSTVQVIPCD